ELASLCANMVALLAERDRLRRQVDESSAISSVSATMMRSTFQGEAAMGLFLRLGSGLVGADGGMVVVVDETGKAPWTPAYWGLPEDAHERMTRELARSAELSVPMMDPIVLEAGADGTDSMPEWLAGMEINSLWIIPFTAERRPGAVVYWFKSPRNLEGYVRPMLEMISDRVASAVRNIKVYEEMLESYLETLTSIVDLLDSQEPSTANHSMLISKYSRDTALAMELSPEEAEAVSLAAYLHDVGMIGMGEDVLFRRGRLAASEYESVMRHAQLGATLTEPVIRPLPIAPLIRHHHERYDGWGYPAGLKGDQIPLGARIIAVADFFNAKASSRNYRKALPYEKAMTDLQAAAGSQLDPEVVDAFVRLWGKRQKNAERKGKPLEDCWVMMQCPSRIASMCPAYKSARNCWEVPGVQCSMHGDECETCLVYTEYRFRQRKAQLRVIAGGRTQE
ncbi:MAG: HD domain-containing phosphohydrolase, partial [Bacillota bacterium]